MAVAAGQNVVAALAIAMAPRLVDRRPRMYIHTYIRTYTHAYAPPPPVGLPLLLDVVVLERRPSRIFAFTFSIVSCARRVHVSARTGFCGLGGLALPRRICRGTASPLKPRKGAAVLHKKTGFFMLAVIKNQVITKPNRRGNHKKTITKPHGKPVQNPENHTPGPTKS